MKTQTRPVTLDSYTFEDVRRSVDRLPTDGDTLTLTRDDLRECALCAYSFGAAQFAKRYSRRQLVIVTKRQSVTKPSRSRFSSHVAESLFALGADAMQAHGSQSPAFRA